MVLDLPAPVAPTKATMLPGLAENAIFAMVGMPLTYSKLTCSNVTWPAVILSPFLPIPNALVYAAAGWTGMSWVTFLILDAIGSLAWVGMLAGLGWALGQSAIDVAQEISKYGLWFTIAIVVLVVAAQIRGQRART